jgi:hypothetical protein
MDCAPRALSRLWTGGSRSLVVQVLASQADAAVVRSVADGLKLLDLI